MTFELGPKGSGLVLAFADSEDLGEVLVHDDGSEELVEEMPAVVKLSLVEAMKLPEFRRQHPEVDLMPEAPR